MKIQHTSTEIEGISILSMTRHHDSRGSFKRIFCGRDLQVILGNRQIKQINHSITNDVGALRGLHFQRSPNEEMKIIQCVRGRVLDVAVDLRQESSTYLHHFKMELDEDDDLAVVVPEGFAHGFQVLEPRSELIYFHTAYYCQDAEGGLRYNDPKLNIDWPLPPSDISDRDQNHPLLPSP